MAKNVKLILVSLVSFLSITAFCFAENAQVQSSAAPKTGGSAVEVKPVKKEKQKTNFQPIRKHAKSAPAKASVKAPVKAPAKASTAVKTVNAAKVTTVAEKKTAKSNVQTREKPAKCSKVKKATWSGTCGKTKTVDEKVKDVKKEAPKQNIQPLKTETKTGTK